MIEFLTWVPFGHPTAPVWGWLLAAFTLGLLFWWFIGYKIRMWVMER